MQEKKALFLIESGLVKFAGKLSIDNHIDTFFLCVSPHEGQLLRVRKYRQDKLTEYTLLNEEDSNRIKIQLQIEKQAEL